MNQIKFYKFVVTGLLLLNIFVLTFFLLSQTKPRFNRARPNTNFQEEVPAILELDSAQQLTFNALADQHNRKIDSINIQQQKLLLPYFESIANDSVDLDNELVATQFQQLERQKLVTTHQHFIEVKNLLHTRQIPLFKLFMKDITDRIVMKKKKRPTPKDFK